MAEQRVIVEQFDPRRPKAGGIDTCIRGLLSFAPEGVALKVVGLDTRGDLALGEWHELDVAGRRFPFMPVGRADHGDLTRRVPHSATLTAGLARYRPLRGADVVQSHRVNVGAAIVATHPRTDHVQFLHSSGVANLGPESRSLFKRARSAYRVLEKTSVTRSRDVVVFSRSGAERLQRISSRVRFSPTWFDPTVFFRRTTARPAGPMRALWACRIEPAKDPQLAIAALAAVDDDVRLTVIGEGTLDEKMRAAAVQHRVGDRVEFRGLVDKREVGEVMRAHDVLLMSSVFEGFSRTVVEGLACGLPVASTPGGEPNGLIANGVNGFRTDDRDAAALGAALRQAAALDPSAAAASVAELDARFIVRNVLTGQ